MAKGSADAGSHPVLAVIGDSTFLHSGVTPLMDAVAHDTPMTVLILDNETVAMTGQQPTVLPDSRLAPIIRGVGVDPDHFHVVETHPRKTPELAELLRGELAHPGLSVILAVRECIVAVRQRKAKQREEAGS
jgi:indolepyruvate ferredoxin oxidoreductase alpha subunit